MRILKEFKFNECGSADFEGVMGVIFVSADFSGVNDGLERLADVAGRVFWMESDGTVRIDCDLHYTEYHVFLYLSMSKYIRMR